MGIFLNDSRMQKLMDAKSYILSNFDKIIGNDISFIHDSESAFNSVCEWNTQVFEYDGTGRIFFLRVNHIGTLV